MRLKSYNAASMAEAMRLIREELGEDAIIVSTQRGAGGKGVRITAATENAGGDDELNAVLSGGKSPPVLDALRKALEFHGAPTRLTERLMGAARTVEAADPTTACAAALDVAFTFAPLPERSAPRPFMLVGPPGAGKTVTVAKLAARGVLRHRKVAVLTADSIRAGAVDQLAAFTRILDIDLKKARGPDSLRRLLDDVRASHDLIFIDSPSLNPFSGSDMDYLAALAQSTDVEPILVLAAGGDPVEAAEVAEGFAAAGATRLLATRLDMTRRLGGILAAAEAAQLMFCDVTAAPHVATGLGALNPASLARLIVPPQKAAARKPKQDRQSNAEPPLQEARS